jgi:hypothetical protein
MPEKQHPARLLVGLFNDSDLAAVLHAARIGLADEDVCFSVGMGTGITAPRMRAVQELLHGFAERNRAALCDPSNSDRAKTARETMSAYVRIKNGSDDAKQDEDDIIDLLADLFHAFGRERMADAFRIAEGHYQYELSQSEIEGSEDQ